MPASPEFDPDQLHDEIAELRGLVDRMAEVIGDTNPPPTQVLGGGLVATDPVNGGPETWHALSLQAGWTNTGAPAAQYRLIASPASTIELIGDITAGTTTDNTQIAAALPSAYFPASAQSAVLVTIGNTSPNSTPRLTISTAGLLKVVGIANPPLTTPPTSVRFHAFFSLDA